MNLKIDGKKIKGFADADSLSFNDFNEKHYLGNDHCKLHPVDFGKFECIKDGLIEEINYIHSEKLERMSNGDILIITDGERHLEVEVIDVEWKKCYIGTNRDGNFIERSGPYWIENVQFKLSI